MAGLLTKATPPHDRHTPPSWAIAWVLAGIFSALDGCMTMTEPRPPVLSDSTKAEILFGKIQQTAFKPICTYCHSGETPAQGMNLSGDTARQIIGRPSSEMPGVLIVNPGNPDSSYIIWKLEGRSGIDGVRMPWGMPPLGADTIQMFKDWIRLLKPGAAR